MLKQTDAPLSRPLSWCAAWGGRAQRVILIASVSTSQHALKSMGVAAQRRSRRQPCRRRCRRHCRSHQTGPPAVQLLVGYNIRVAENRLGNSAKVPTYALQAGSIYKLHQQADGAAAAAASDCCCSSLLHQHQHRSAWAQRHMSMLQAEPTAAQLELGVAAAHTLHARRAHAAAAGRGLRQGEGSRAAGGGISSSVHLRSFEMQARVTPYRGSTA